MSRNGQEAVQHKRAKRALAWHGAGAGGWEFALWQAVFQAADWQFEAPDLSASEQGLEQTQFSDYAAQVETALTTLAPGLLLGASLGGLLALCAARRSATDCALVLINPLPPAPFHSLLPARSWPARVLWQHRHALRATQRALGDASPATAWIANQNWRDESGAVLHAAYQGIALPAPPRRVLMLISEQDTDVPPAVSEQVAAWCGADKIRLPGQTHVGPLLGKRASAIAEQVLAWCELG